MPSAKRKPLSSSSSSVQGEGWGSYDTVPIPFPRPAPRTEDEDDEKLAWARDLDDLRQRLVFALDLHPVEVEEALRLQSAAVVEGAALKTLYLSKKGVVRRSRSGFFFTTLRRGLGWSGAQVKVYLEIEAAKGRCDDCPNIGVCPSCGRGEPGKWRS